MRVYLERPETGNPHRERFFGQFEAWLDQQFDVGSTRSNVPQVRARYEHLNIADRFACHEHPGDHEFHLSDDGIEFLCRHLDQAR